MENSKTTKITLVDLLKSSANNSTYHPNVEKWVPTKSTNNHIYFNDEWNGGYKD